MFRWVSAGVLYHVTESREEPQRLRLPKVTFNRNGFNTVSSVRYFNQNEVWSSNATDIKYNQLFIKELVMTYDGKGRR